MIERVTQKTIAEIRPLVEAYAEEVPADPWAWSPIALADAIAGIVDNPAYLVLVGRAGAGDPATGFLLAEIKNDSVSRALIAVVHAAYLLPSCRGRNVKGVRDAAVGYVKRWGASLGASHVACLAGRGRAVERVLGWRYAGTHLNRDFLMDAIEPEFPKAVAHGD